MYNYDDKYYKDIWGKILSIYKISDPIIDLGDISRANILDQLLVNYLIPKFKHKNIIIYDFGPGNWLYLNVMLKIGKYFNKVDITGVDFSKEAMSFGLQKYNYLINKKITINMEDGNLENKIKSITPNSIDCIICLETLEHLYNDEDIIRGFGEILKPGGFLIISVPNKSLFPLSLMWFKYCINQNQLIKKDQIVGHLRRYQSKDVQSMGIKTNLKIIKTVGYGFLLSDYMKKILNYTESYFPLLLNVMFNLCKKILLIENIIFNLLKIKDSEGFFVLFQKE